VHPSNITASPWNVTEYRMPHCYRGGGP
jgi:hypothetical protein